jgi:hypothetical protein
MVLASSIAAVSLMRADPLSCLGIAASSTRPARK